MHCTCKRINATIDISSCDQDCELNCAAMLCTALTYTDRRMGHLRASKMRSGDFSALSSEASSWAMVSMPLCSQVLMSLQCWLDLL